MPLECLHMTVLEIAHSRSKAEIEYMVEIMAEKIPEITDFTYSHRARLVKPIISYDAAAIALSFLPAAGEPSSGNRETTDDAYMLYHPRTLQSRVLLLKKILQKMQEKDQIVKR